LARSGVSNTQAVAVTRLLPVRNSPGRGIVSSAVASRMSGAINRSEATLESESAWSSVAELIDRPDTESCTVT
jgi:hypothetical protein